MPTGKQIRAARVLLDWDAKDLASRVGLRRETILSIENSLSHPRTGTMDKIIRVFGDNGVEFKDERGVELRDDRVREIDGADCYAKLLDEIYYQLEKSDEFLIAWADESLSPPAVHDAFRRIVKKGIKFRKLIQQGSTCIYGPLSWYRYVPSHYYQNATAVFLKDKSAYVTEDLKKVIILRDKALAKANKNLFEIIWSSASAPKETSVNETYR